MLLVAMATSNVAMSTPVSEVTAKKVAFNFLSKVTSDVKTSNLLSLVNIGDKYDQAYYYIFNYKNGWVVIAGDDRVIPIIGYSTEGSLKPPDKNNETERENNFWAMMKNYEDQIKYVVENNISTTEKISSQWDEMINNSSKSMMSPNTVVSPLLTTTWDQVWPYNAMCPSGAVTGCVSTAMGQILAYHDYPNQGLGSYGYQWGSYPYTGANFGATNYNFSIMPNSISTMNTPADSAVARLLYQIGVSCRAMWGSNTGVLVTSTDNPMVTSFINYFKMAFSSIRYVQKSDYTDADWDNLIQAELIANRPVYYRGDGSLSHAWVCDGVDASNMYHFNWGWGGMYNGYFALSNLNPGGNNLTNNQAAIVGIKPNDGSTLVTNTVWTGTITKTSNIAVPDAITLTINPGATVQFAQNCKLQVWGKLTSIGTASNYAKLTAINTSNGWEGLDIVEDYLGRMSDNDTTKLIYTQIEYSKSSGIYCNNYGKVIIDHCKVNNNDGGYGGGLNIWYKPIPVYYSEFYNNHATIQGGGIFIGQTNTFYADLNNNNLHDNVSDIDGGGFYSSAANYVTWSWNIINSNQAIKGAGGVISGGSPTIVNNKFCNNITPSPGFGCLYLENCNANIVNNLIANNTANGICLKNNSNPLIINNTIVNNNHDVGSGIIFDAYCNAVVKNCIIYGNISNYYANQIQIGDLNCDPYFDHCDIQGGLAGFGGPGAGANYTSGNYTNNIDSNPLFVNPSAGAGNGYNGLTADWSLQFTPTISPCINTGDTTGVSNLLPVLDLAGNPRINGIIDMGAYEYQSMQIAFLINGIIKYDNFSGTPCANVQVSRCSGVQVLDSVYTDTLGQYSFSNVAIGSYALLCKSTHAWGGVNATDALTIMKHFVGMSVLTGVRLLAAELNGDGIVNSIDAMMAMKRFVGLQTSFATGNWRFEQPEVQITGNTSLNVKGLCNGDVDGSYTP